MVPQSSGAQMWKRRMKIMATMIDDGDEKGRALKRKYLIKKFMRIKM